MSVRSRAPWRPTLLEASSSFSLCAGFCVLLQDVEKSHGYRHGLRVSELVTMRWDQIDFKVGSMHVNRLENGLASTHRIHGVELRALRAVRKDYPDSPYVFVTERDGPMTPAAARKLITRAGVLAKLPFPIHKDGWHWST